jgi:hypothetical protein
MPRRNRIPESEALTLESIAKLDHYQVLGLTEAASSEDIQQALQIERWPWHLLDEEARKFATARRVEAFGVLNDPTTRAAYDRRQGYTKGYLAGRIGDATSIWGQTWLVLFAVIGLLMVMGGPDHPARAVGSALAPDFQEVFVRKEPDCPPLDSCPIRYEREFRSSSDAWRSVLNGWLPWIVPPILAIGAGFALRPLIAGLAGYVVASMRFAGRSDGVTRFLMLLLVATVPIAFLAAYWILPPGGPAEPPGI